MAQDLNFQQPKPTANSDKKVWEVIKASKKDFDGVIGRGKEARFGKRTKAFVTSDPDFAKEIHDRYGYSTGGSRDVIVVERPAYQRPTSRAVHSFPRVPWHEEDGEDGIHSTAADR